MKNQNFAQRNFLVYVIFVLAILFLDCVKEKTVPTKKILEGWAGNPNNPQSKPFDYFYMKSKGNASETFIKKKNKQMIEWTCIDKATSYAKLGLGMSIIHRGGILGDCTCGCTGCAENLDDFSEVRISIVSLVTCPTDYTNVTLLAPLISEIAGKINVNHTDCKPTASIIRDIPGSEWRECECTVYTHIPGGRKALWEKCIELEKKFENKK